VIEPMGLFPFAEEAMTVRIVELNGLKSHQIHSDASEYSGMLAFPIVLDDDSGVAHVLEHMVCLQRTQNGHSFQGLANGLPDVRVNAITEADHIAFYFTCRSRESFSITLDTLIRAALIENLDPKLFAQEAYFVKAGNPDVG
jgi:Zn-dependent M16 (insulinase) family peptidase